MKKIFIVILFLYFIETVYATNPCIQNKNQESLWYKIEEESKYYRLNENEKTYPILDKNIFYKTDFTNWINVKPENKEEREIEKREIFIYQDSYPIHYLFLHNFIFNGTKLNIREIQIYDKDNIKVPNKMTCTNCSESFEETVNDGNVITGDAYIKKDSILKIEFLNYEPTENFRIYIYTEEQDKEKTKLEVTATEKDDIEDVFYHKKYELSVLNLNIQKRYYFNIHIKDLEKVKPRYKNEIRSEQEVKEKYNRKVKKETEYRYRDTFYRYYNITKIYDKEYRKEGTKEYPYKEVGILSNQKHCYENEIITFKNKISKLNISLKNLPKPLKINLKKTNQCTCPKEKKSIYFYLFYFFIIFRIIKYVQRKRKEKKTCQQSK